MKKIIIALTAILVSISAIAQDGKSIYSKYSDMDGVEAVYISPAMFRIIGKIPDLNVGDDHVNIVPLLQSMKGFYVINTSKTDIGASLYKDVDSFVKKGEYELLLEAKENGEVTRIYTVGTEKIVNGIVLLSRNSSETDFIAIDGQMDRDKLESVIAEAAKDK